MLGLSTAWARLSVNRLRRSARLPNAEFVRSPGARVAADIPCCLSASRRWIESDLEENCRTREFPGVLSTIERVELLLVPGEGLTLLDGLVARMELFTDEFDWDCNSRRRAAIRSTMDCRLNVLRSDTSDDARPPILAPIPFVASELIVPFRSDRKDVPAEEF